MKKILVGLLVLVMLCSAFMATALAANDEFCGYECIPTYIDGELVTLDVPALLIEETTYVPVRAFSNALGATDVFWDNGTVVITAPELTVNLVCGEKYIEANGRYFYARTGIRMVGDYMYMPIRALCKAFDAEVEWLNDERAVGITSGSGHCIPGDQFYNSDDVYWMSHIIYAESGNQCLEGQIAVGTVVLNRVASSMYPNTIYDVIFDFNCGIQFSPAADGSIYKDPSAMSIMCAKLVLDGAKEADDCLFFAAIKDCWAAYNRPYYCTIQDVDFYL